MKKKMQNIATDLATYAKEKFSGYDAEIVFPLANQVNVYVYCDVDNIDTNDIIDIGSKYSSEEFRVEILIPKTIISESGEKVKNTKRVDIALISMN